VSLKLEGRLGSQELFSGEVWRKNKRAPFSRGTWSVNDLVALSRVGTRCRPGIVGRSFPSMLCFRAVASCRFVGEVSLNRVVPSSSSWIV
jgi:hypothetical protein